MQDTDLTLSQQNSYIYPHQAPWQESLSVYDFPATPRSLCFKLFRSREEGGGGTVKTLRFGRTTECPRAAVKWFRESGR